MNQFKGTPHGSPQRPSNGSPNYALLLGFSITGWIGVAIAFYISIVWPQVLPQQGVANRIFYFHVAQAWGALYGPLVMAVAGVAYLRGGRIAWDERGHAAAIVSLAYCLGVLTTGPIWAKSAWNVYWDWSDLRLQTFFVMFMTLAAYLFLRATTTDFARRAKISAWLAIILAANGVFVWFSIRIFKTDTTPHPSSVLQGGALSSEQLSSMFIAAGAWSIVWIGSFLLVRNFLGLKSAYETRRRAQIFE